MSEKDLEILQRHLVILMDYYRTVLCQEKDPRRIPESEVQLCLARLQGYESALEFLGWSPSALRASFRTLTPDEDGVYSLFHETSPPGTFRQETHLAQVWASREGKNLPPPLVIHDLTAILFHLDGYPVRSD